MNRLVLRVTAPRKVEVKLYNKLKAIELLMRHMGLLRDKTIDREKVIRVEMAEEVKDWAK